jgi:HSP20 family molecular chaperone IbpA
MTLLEPFPALFELSCKLDRRLASGATAPSFGPPADLVVTDGEVTVIMDVASVQADT